MSEASPRPWRLSDSDPTLILDADGLAVCRLAGYRPDDVAVPTAALIVAMVNALGDPALVEMRDDAEAHAKETGICALPLEHRADCECARL